MLQLLNPDVDFVGSAGKQQVIFIPKSNGLNQVFW